MFKEKTNEYIYPDKNTTEVKGQNLYFPVELDTEYTHLNHNLDIQSSKKILQTITAQCRSIIHEKGKIYTHPDSEYMARHKIFRSDFVLIEYLNDYGYKIKITRLPSWDTKTKLPFLQVDIFSFFALAEICKIFQGKMLADIDFLMVNPGTSGIEQGRRIRTYTKSGRNYFNWVELPWIININSYDYRLRICIYDTSAMHGAVSYSAFCKNSGVELEYKDSLNQPQKSNMHLVYIEKRNDFDNYALGDLYNYKALLGNVENFEKIYESLGLKNYFTIPKLTIGATVARLFEAALKNIFNVDYENKEVINAFCKHTSSEYLKKKSTTTACYNAKVDGGRCRNNRPIETTFTGALCDIDISGCYGEGLRVQTYPLGVPFIIDYPIRSKNNNYDTLRKFLKKYGNWLTPGLWQCRVSLKTDYKLKHPQDYLASWFPPRDISKMVTDTELVATDDIWDIDNVGEIKILTNEIHHAIITHDFIQWLDNVASEKQRVELLDNLLIETAIIYRNCDRVETVEELIVLYKNHSGKNTTDVKGRKQKGAKINVERECYAWYGINLGELLVDKLLLERRKYSKKTSFNNLYKLIINTLYGDMVSPFFAIGNVVVGNNITARARALAWCMEKGLHGWQSITDGCTFDLNRVLVPRTDRRITGELVVNLYTDNLYKHHTFKSLLTATELSVTVNSSTIEVVDYQEFQGLKFNQGDDTRLLSPNESYDWVNAAAMQHLQRLFPNLDVLHQVTKDVYGNERKGQFQFEAKGFFEAATFHGTANYSLKIDNVMKLAMRSYSKRTHKTVKCINGVIDVVDNQLKPSETFLASLYNPSRVPRGDVYLRERILKVGDYKHNYRKWENTQIMPGTTVDSPSILHEFNLSQFTFITYSQYKAWSKEHLSLLHGYGQSYEMFFINDDNTLNYQLMIETIDKCIRGGKNGLFDGLTKEQLETKKIPVEHPAYSTLQVVNERLAIIYNNDSFNDLSD